MKMTIVPLKHSRNRSSSPLASLLTMKEKISLMVIFTAFLVCPLVAGGQCPQLCDPQSNTAVGNAALDSLNGGVENTAVGTEALESTTTGSQNVAMGSFAGLSIIDGGANVAIGDKAIGGGFFSNGEENVAVGYAALNLCTGSNNIGIGAFGGTDLGGGHNNIYVGNRGLSSESDTIRIGTEGTQTATYIAGIRGTPLANGAAVGVGITADGQLGVRTSSARFKEAIKPMDKASEAIFSLQPVTFRYKKDPAVLAQFGLVAEEVAKVNPDLVVRDVEGKPFTVRYDEINAMLLNEFLKEHKAFVEEQRKVHEQGATIARQQKQIEALTAGLQKVSAELELSKAAPQTVQNRQ